MTEIITSSVSSRKLLQAKGCEVITRCKDCKHWGIVPKSYDDGAGYCSFFIYHHADDAVTGALNYCCWGIPRG